MLSKHAMMLIASSTMIILALGIIVVPSQVSAKQDPELIPGRYIVVLKDGESPDAVAETHRLARIHTYSFALNGFAANVADAVLAKVQSDPRVLFVQQDRIVETFAQTLPTGVDRIDGELNSIAKIDGIDERVDVDIAILDTGIKKTHTDLNIAGGVCYASFFCSNWDDGNGHGTHVAGTAAAEDNGIGVVGVAPGARLWAVKVLSNSGSGYLSNVVRGVDWVTANAAKIEVANMSVGASGSDDGNCGNTNNDALHKAICKSVAKGVVYVVAAGNAHADAKNTIPAAYDEVITVSALADFNGNAGGGATPTCRSDGDDTFADFSNYGSDVDLIAPGVCILSTWKDGGYYTISGTSMATPHVTGTAALYVYKNGKPIDTAGVASVRLGLIAQGTSQSSAEGYDFTGDLDAYREPLVNPEAISP